MTEKKSIAIKPLTAGDLNSVVEIDSATSGISRRGYFEKRLTAGLNRPKDYVYVGLFAKDKLQGFALARLVVGEFGNAGASAALDAIATRPEVGHQGYGQMLLDEVEKVLRHKGVSALTSQVDWGNPDILGFLAGNGFQLSSRLILTRSTAEIPPELIEEPEDDGINELDYSSAESDDFQALSRDRVPVRSMVEGDLAKIISIDADNSGSERAEYYSRKLHQSLHESGVRVSLAAELDGFVVGFIMARVDFGEFGHTSPEAVMDSIGVDPGFAGQGVGKALMSQLMANLAVLRVERLRTEIAWNDTGLIRYLDATGFSPAQRITLYKPL